MQVLLAKSFYIKAYNCKTTKNKAAFIELKVSCKIIYAALKSITNSL